VLFLFVPSILAGDFGYNYLTTSTSTISATNNTNDTNESIRFNILVATDCDEGDFVVGVDDDGTLSCSTPTGGSDNSSWNESYASTLYSGIEWAYNQSESTFEMWNSTWSIDTDTTYTAGSNLTLAGNEFSIDMTNLVDYLQMLFLEIGDNLEWGNLTNKPANLDEDSTDDLLITDLPLENKTISHCSNITGAVSDLCTITGGGGSFNNTNLAYTNNSNLFTQNQIIESNLNVTNMTLGGCTETWNGTCSIKNCPTTVLIQC